MEEMITYKGYQEYKAALDSELARTAEGFVRIGYLLRLAADTDILLESGYANVLEFAQKEYGLDKSQVSRFIAINERFSAGGYSDTLETQYRGFGYAKLAIMLQLPEAVNEVLTPDFSKAEIQAIKREVDEEKKISDLEILTESMVPDVATMDNLQKAVCQMGRENPEMFSKLYESPADPKAYQEILAPAGESMISVRIQGIGRLMLSIKDVDREISLVNVRSNERESYTWEQMAGAIGQITGRTALERPADARRGWEAVYKEEWPVTEKADVAPVQPGSAEKPKPRKESKVTAAKPEPPKVKKPEPKKEPPKKEPTAEVKTLEPPTPEAPKEPLMPEPTPEVPPAPKEMSVPEESPKPEIAPVQPEEDIPGQIGWDKFPEYLPEGYIVAEDGTEVLPAPEKTARYEVQKDGAEFVLYEYGEKALSCRNIRNAMLIKAILEKEEAAEALAFTEEDCKEFFERNRE